MNNNSADFIASHTNEELLRMAYRYDSLEPGMQEDAAEELRRRDALPPDFEERRHKLIAEEDENLSDGREASFPQQFFGWLGIFGILGLIIGHDLYFGKSTSIYTGKEYPRYDEESRESGRYMFYVSVFTHTAFILYKVVPLAERLFR